MPLTNDDYTVGWIAALPSEAACAQAMLDEEHDDLDSLPDDTNVYTLGRIGQHNVVIAQLPKGVLGTTAASNTATNLVRSFANIRFGLLVGVGGGVPSKKNDIRLGDVVVSTPIGQTGKTTPSMDQTNGLGGVIQFDLGTNVQHAEFIRKGFLRDPPAVLQKAVAKMIATAERKGYQFAAYHETMLERNKRMNPKYSRPNIDTLFQVEYEHEGEEDNCLACDASRIVKRRDREEIEVHYGLIGSGNQVVRDAIYRDKWHKKEGILCFEMEAAGLMTNFECMVIRGICDYCDTHKNKNWQPYAAAIAAAYAKELLLTIPAQQVKAMPQSTILQSIHEEVQDGTRAIHRVEQYQISDAVQNALRWVGAPDAEANYRAALKVREEHTGQWLLDSTTFKEWKANSNKKNTRHLWLCGKAGSGKSILSAIAIEELRQYCSQTKAGLGIFYFTFSDQGKRSWLDCLKSLVVQLAVNTPAAAKLVEEFNRQRSSLDEKTLYDTLIVAIRSYPETFIVLDALDESPTDSVGNSTIRESLLEQLGQLANEVLHVKFLLTSRDLPDIQRQMIRISARLVPMERDLVNRDIEKYLDTRLREHYTLASLDPETKNEIKATLMNKADGMFRWVQCQIDRLSQLTTMRPSEIRETLKTLPETLDKTYERMLGEILPASRKKAANLLKWLAYARRPLTIEELSETLIINLDSDTVDFDDRARRPAGILDDLKGLIKTKPKRRRRSWSVEFANSEFLDNSLTDSDSQRSSVFEPQRLIEESGQVEIELGHFSVKEYLESSRSMLPLFQLDEYSCQDFIANCCLTYVMRYADSQERMDNEKDIRKFPLLEYGAESWYQHYRDDNKADRAASLLGLRKYTKIWHRVHPKYGSQRIPLPFHTKVEDPPGGLWIASHLGLHTVVMTLIEQYGTDVNAQNERDGCAIYAASSEGHENVIKLLVEQYGANVNVEGGFYGSALQAASLHGHENIVELLIEQYGADVDAKGGYEDTALYAASVHGHENIVKLLIAAKADVNLQKGHYGTALQAAVSSGSDNIVKLLIAANADVNAQGGSLGSALQAASFFGHENIVRLLIAANTDVNAQGGPFGNALQAASYRGDENIIKLLIAAHADVNAQGGDFGSALQAASFEGHENVVKLLIAANADVNAQGGVHGAALQVARRRGHENVIRILIDAGAEESSPEESDRVDNSSA